MKRTRIIEFENMTGRLTKSKNFTEEYCCSVVRVGELEPVENSDNLMRTRINGESIVVNKQDVKEGDVMLYVSNECEISHWFLYANNMFRHYTENANCDDVARCIGRDPDFLKTDVGKKMVGYFEDTGRVKMIKLRGCPSFGVLFKPETMHTARMQLILEAEAPPGINPDYGGPIDWDQEVGTDFDTIDDMLFVKPYVPRNTPGSGKQGHGQKGVTRWDRLSRMVPGQFRLHYDTAPLKKHLMDFNPKIRIDVTVKMHGTSFICANVLTKTPLRLFKVRRWVNRLFGRELIKEARQEYGMVVSSRKVIKNEWSGCNHPEGYYGVDVWTEYGNIIFPYLDRGLTVYGEICGYLSGGKMIQKDYDYGCKPDTNFLMIYRATQHTDEGLRELSIGEVIKLTDVIKARMADAGDKNVGRIFNIGGVVLYEGTVAQLLAGIGNVPDPKVDYDMRDFPDRLAERCQIEGDEPLCRNRVPREGVVVRIDGDEVAEAFKLKSLRFLEREKKAIDKGEVDMEMTEVAATE